MVNSSKVPYFNLIPIIILSIILYKTIDKLDIFLLKTIDLLSIISPFIWAFAIAYLLNPLMNHLERNFNLKRMWSILIIYLIVLGIIVFGITIISPKIAKSIGELLKELPHYFEVTENWLRDKITKLKVFDKYGVTSYLENYLNNIIYEVSEYLNAFLSKAVSKLIIFTSTFFKIILGLIISIYLLKDKEKFIRTIKKFLYSVFTGEKAGRIVEFGKELDNIFSRFIIGKFIDSCIIGIICFLGLMLLKAPYSLLLSFIVGLTNMIPYFGPFIGMIPAVIITLFYSPIKAVWVFLFILLLQQFDGLYLGPKILGDKVGLSPFWIILAIVLGGGTFGVLGMFLAVPVMAVIKTLLERYVNRRLETNNINI